MAADRWIEVNGVSLRYRLQDAPGPTLVLVHEMGGCIESSDDVVEMLGNGFRVLRYDQRGFGLSEKSSGFTLATMVEDLRALLDALEITGPVSLAGSALGASICMAFALEHPDRVAKLVLSSPATGATPMARRQLTAWMDEVTSEGVRAITDRMWAIAYPPGLGADPQRMRRHRCRWLSMTPASYVAICQMMMAFDLTPRLPELERPTLVLGGTHDHIRPAAASAEIASLIPGAEYVEVATGHYAPLQHPELFAAQLRRFVGEAGNDAR